MSTMDYGPDWPPAPARSWAAVRRRALYAAVVVARRTCLLTALYLIWGVLAGAIT